MQMSAMKVYFQIAECSLSSAKIMFSCDICKKIGLILIKKPPTLTSGRHDKKKCKEVKGVKEFQMWKWISLSHLRVSKQGQALRTPGRSQ